MTIDLIIFDWSGVISNDKEVALYALNSAFSQYNVPPVDLKTFCDNYGNIEEIMSAKYGVQIPINDFWNLYERFVRLCPNKPVMIPGVDKILEELNHCRRLVVFSSHSQKSLDEDARRYSLTHLFHILQGGVRYKSQNIDNFVQSMSVSKDNVVYVGDTAVDGIAARKAGVKFVGVLTGYHNRTQLEETNPYRIIETLDELPELIKRT